MSLREELVAKMDILAEYEAIGLRVAKGARPNAEGWLSCHALGREDNKPSAVINVGTNPKARGIYKDFWHRSGVFAFQRYRGLWGLRRRDPLLP